MRILAINPGSRYLGIAIFQGPELLDWGIKVIRKGRIKERSELIKRILSDLIDRHELNVMAIKKLHPSRTSSHLKRLVLELRGMARRKGMRIYQCPLEAIESFLSPSGRTNKKLMAELVSQEYSFFFHELEKEKKNLNPYHIRMFEAVALGLVCLHQIENKN